jgi:hypothetical protein
MLHRATELENVELRAIDGRIGHVTDLFFDDRRWTIRYLVVDTGTWLDHREVLISPTAAGTPDWSQRVLPVNLTRDEVRHSPPVDPEEPVSREQELMLAQYYNWPLYWGAAGFSDGVFMATPPFLPANLPRPTRRQTSSTLDEQHHIRSVNDVRGYRLEADDGEIGHIDDFLIDDEAWQVRSFIIDTRNWWPGRRVLVSPEAIFEVGWDEAKVFADVTREAVRRSPPYDPHHLAEAAARVDRPLVREDYPRRSAEP